MNTNTEPDADGIAIYVEKARSAQKKNCGLFPRPG